MEFSNETKEFLKSAEQKLNEKYHKLGWISESDIRDAINPEPSNDFVDSIFLNFDICDKIVPSEQILIKSLSDFIKDNIDNDGYFDISTYTSTMLGVTKKDLNKAIKIVTDTNKYSIIQLRKQVTATNFRIIKLIVKSDFKYEDIYNKFIKEDD